MGSPSARPMGMRRNNSTPPVPNKILEEKRQEYLKRVHEGKVAHARAYGTSQSNSRPDLDTSPPTFYPHVAYNAKKMALEEDRYLEIERENAVLLNKLAHIAKSSSSASPGKPGSASTPFKPGLRLDANQRPTIDMGEPRREPAKSLNAGRRKEELIRIMRENQAILERIQKSEGVYKQAQWGEDARKQEEYLANCSRAPRSNHLFSSSRDLSHTAGSSARSDSPSPTSTSLTLPHIRRTSSGNGSQMGEG
eukprot:jgi/Mesvir1/17787/Mv12898-RA.1